MMAVDTSALMAILLEEPEGTACAAALATSERTVISAATVAEALVVAERRGLGSQMKGLLDGLDLEIVNVSLVVAQAGLRKVMRDGARGMNPAGLNFGGLLRPRSCEDI